MLNKSLGLVERNLLPSMQEKPDILLFHEPSFGPEFKSKVRPVTAGAVLFQEIEFRLPPYPPRIADAIPEYVPHPTHGNGPLGWGHPGFGMGYRFMCDFFAGSMYDQAVLQGYEYYLRLDTDSFILSPVRYDMFERMQSSGCEYGFIETALQQDEPAVIEGLWSETKRWIDSNAIRTQVPIAALPEGRMFYTNFELGKVASFSPGSDYYRFYSFIRETGNIFIRRWGDAPIKYLGVNLFIRPEAVQGARGFRYQHGAIFDLPGYHKPFPWKDPRPRRIAGWLKSLLS